MNYSFYCSMGSLISEPAFFSEAEQALCSQVSRRKKRDKV